MNIHDLFPSNYLKASDLQGQTVRVTIERCAIEQIDGEQKPIIFFQGKKKGLVLNKCNAFALADMFGPETDNWLGRTIKLRPDKTTFQGRPVGCLRVGIDAPEAAGNTTF